MKEKSGDRFGSFFDRVQTERSVMRIINARFSGTQKLNGITEATINSWVVVTKKSKIYNCENIDTVAAILKRLSCRIGALADQSRTVFSDERFPVLPTDEVLGELELACKQS